MKALLPSFVVVMCMAALPVAQQTVPEIQFQSVPDFLDLPPDLHFGEVAGVAVNSKATCSCSRVPIARAVPRTRQRRLCCSSSVPKGSSFVKSARDSTHGPLRTPFGSTEMTTSGRSTKAPIWSSSSMTDRAGVDGIRPQTRSRPTTKPMHGSTLSRHCPQSTDCSGSRRTLPGIRPVMSTSPTATSTHAWPNTRRTATG